MNTDTFVYLDTETTGLEAGYDEVVAIAIVDHDGNILVNSLVQPERRTSWPDAEAINGIAPATVRAAPTLAELGPTIRAAVADRQVVIYNADFDTGFLGDLLSAAAAVHCCMLDWAEDAGEWSELVEAAAAVEFEWPAAAHGALPDALACRTVWLYRHDPQVRADIEARREARQQEQEDAWEVERALQQMAWATRQRDRQRAEHATRFIAHWWLGRYGPGHWTAQYGRFDRDKALDELCLAFFDTSRRGLELMDAHPDACYGRQADIPAHLKPASWFDPSAMWYRRELRPCAAYVGRQRAWPLYHRNEKHRLNRKFRLRLAAIPPDTDRQVSGSRSWLRKLGYRSRDIDQMPVVAERYNQVRHTWYPVYRAPRGEATKMGD